MSRTRSTLAFSIRNLLDLDEQEVPIEQEQQKSIKGPLMNPKECGLSVCCDNVQFPATFQQPTNCPQSQYNPYQIAYLLRLAQVYSSYSSNMNNITRTSEMYGLNSNQQISANSNNFNQFNLSGPNSSFAQSFENGPFIQPTGQGAQLPCPQMNFLNNNFSNGLNQNQTSPQSSFHHSSNLATRISPSLFPSPELNSSFSSPSNGRTTSGSFSDSVFNPGFSNTISENWAGNQGISHNLKMFSSPRKENEAVQNYEISR